MERIVRKNTKMTREEYQEYCKSEAIAAQKNRIKKDKQAKKLIASLPSRIVGDYDEKFGANYQGLAKMKEHGFTAHKEKLEQKVFESQAEEKAWSQAKKDAHKAELKAARKAKREEMKPLKAQAKLAKAEAIKAQKEAAAAAEKAKLEAAAKQVSKKKRK